MGKAVLFPSVIKDNEKEGASHWECKLQKVRYYFSLMLWCTKEPCSSDMLKRWHFFVLDFHILCYIFSSPKSPASEMLQDALKSISTQMSLATDRAVQQMDGEHYLESIYNKGKRNQMPQQFQRIIHRAGNCNFKNAASCTTLKASNPMFSPALKSTVPLQSLQPLL